MSIMRSPATSDGAKKRRASARFRRRDANRKPAKDGKSHGFKSTSFRERRNAPPFSVSPLKISIMIELHGVSKTYETVTALHPTDLTIRQGSTTALIGQSGCGKSTLLRLITRLIEPTT